MTFDGNGRRGPETYADEEEPSRRSGRFLPLAIALAALVGFGAIVWYAYSWGVGQVPNQVLPVVRAPEGPVKERPENPGGMEVPYQDKLVLNGRMEGNGGEAVERLLPPPETPQPPEAAPEAEGQPEAETAVAEPPRLDVAEEAFKPEGQSAEAPPAPASEAAPETTAAAAPTPPAPEPVAPKAEAPKPETPKTEPAKAEATQPAPEPEVKPAPTPREAASGAYVMQMASLRSESDAQAAWKRIQAKHVALLEGLKPLVERADLGDRGVFYRLQAGPFPSKATADDLCAQLKAAGQDCLVKKR
jgi:cell division septation protein DedD